MCANTVFKDSWENSGVERRTFEAPPAMGGFSGTAAAPTPAGDQEQLIQMITERVMSALANQSAKASA